MNNGPSLPDSPYNLQSGLKFVQQKPKFLKDIMEKEQLKVDLKNHERDQRVKPPSFDEEPVLVDSEGNYIPNEYFEGDCKIDAAFSVKVEEEDDDDEFDNDARQIEAQLSQKQNDQTDGSLRKKLCIVSPALDNSHTSKKLSKLKSNTKLLSFEEQD